VDLLPGALADWSRSDEGRKAIKYTAVSVISTAVSQAALILVYGFHVFGARGSAIFATCVGTVPSYYLNRNWAWGKSGRSHLVKEVLPFWSLAVVGLVFSTWAVDFTHSHISGITSNVEHTAILAAAYLGAFGTLWVAKFLIFNRFLFIDHHLPKEERDASWIRRRDPDAEMAASPQAPASAPSTSPRGGQRPPRSNGVRPTRRASTP
jgi:putative flippase GtrA